MKSSRCQKGSDAQTSREHPEADSLNSQHQFFFMDEIAIPTDHDNSININCQIAFVLSTPFCADKNLGP